MRGAGNAGQGFEEIGHDGGERRVVLGGPDTGLVVDCLVNGDGNFLYHVRISQTEMGVPGLAGTTLI